MRSPDGMFELEVLVHGRPVQEYPHYSGVFVEGRLGSEYSLGFRNNSNGRVTVVLSVDGLSVMTGQNASRGDHGYVVDPYGYVDVPGWRLNNRRVASFFFGTLPEAYASQMGRPSNIGVIGAAIYFEKSHVAPPVDYYAKGPERSFGGQTLGPTRGSIGTGFGRQIQHDVQGVQFDREEHTAAELVIRYDDANGLRQRGIVVTASHRIEGRQVEAQPFPADEPGVTPPPGWRA